MAIKILLRTLLLSLLVTQSALAQRGDPPVAKLDMMSAQTAMTAALAEADSSDSNVSIAILDANGDLVLFTRKDGASARAVTSSQGKARASLMFGMPSREVQAAIASGEPLTARISAPPGGAWEITPFQGALPIVRNGEIIGAIGVGGVAPSRDEEIAQAGLDALN
tara:strand:- start:3639 stop:4136 length:498 start_codon:yes stop_codon:yes gene_type:complete